MCHDLKHCYMATSIAQPRLYAGEWIWEYQLSRKGQGKYNNPATTGYYVQSILGLWLH